MKHWITPSLDELNLDATAYHPLGGSSVDGSYLSKDGKYTYDTFSPSSGNAGTPDMNGNDPSQDGFNVTVH